MDSETCRFVQALLPGLAQRPPDIIGHINKVTPALLWLIQAPPNPFLDLRFRLFANDINSYGGRDVFRLFATNKYQFFEVTGETPETLLQLVNLLELDTSN